MTYFSTFSFLSDNHLLRQSVGAVKSLSVTCALIRGLILVSIGKGVALVCDEERKKSYKTYRSWSWTRDMKGCVEMQESKLSCFAFNTYSSTLFSITSDKKLKGKLLNLKFLICNTLWWKTIFTPKLQTVGMSKKGPGHVCVHIKLLLMNQIRV